MLGLEKTSDAFPTPLHNALDGRAAAVAAHQPANKILSSATAQHKTIINVARQCRTQFKANLPSL